MNFLFKNILIYVNDKLNKNLLQLFNMRSIKATPIQNYSDYINTLERLKIANEFAVCIHELTKENKNDILNLIDTYKNIRFLFLHSGNITTNDIYDIIINGAIDVISINSDLNLIIAKIIATFRTEFKKEKNKTINSTDGSVILDTENLKIIINNKEYKITKKQSAILSILISNEGMVVERYKIAAVVYSEKIDKVTPQLIDKHLQLIKENIPPLSQKIKSVWGVGYIYENK